MNPNEIASKGDIQGLVTEIMKMRAEINNLISLLPEVKNELINSKEIRERLGISASTFSLLRPTLIKFNMFKEGQWKMHELDLQDYLNFKKSAMDIDQYQKLNKRKRNLN